MVQIQRFSESLEGARSDGMLNIKFGTGHNSGKDHGILSKTSRKYTKF